MNLIDTLIIDEFKLYVYIRNSYLIDLYESYSKIAITSDLEIIETFLHTT